MRLFMYQIYMAWRNRKAKASPKMPYFFSCPECMFFRVDSSDEVVLARIVRDHMTKFHGR